MVKKCVDCGEEARFVIKGTSEYYCEPCAHENFSDLDLLIAVEEEARALSNVVESKIENGTQQ